MLFGNGVAFWSMCEYPPVRPGGSFFLLLLAAAPAWAEGRAYGPELEGFDYAYPVQRFDLESQRQALHMSYLDSTGWMLAARYALLYPGQVEQLVLVNPIGLEDWKNLGVPWRSVDAWFAREMQTTAESIREYEQATYYAGQWRAEYDRWVEMLAGMYRGPGKELVAWNSRRIKNQPEAAAISNSTRSGRDLPRRPHALRA